MKHDLKVIFGKEAVVKFYHDKPLTDEEINQHVKQYHFNSENERQAFINGLNEAVGWTDFCIPALEK